MTLFQKVFQPLGWPVGGQVQHGLGAGAAKRSGALTRSRRRLRHQRSARRVGVQHCTVRPLSAGAGWVYGTLWATHRDRLSMRPVGGI